MALVAASARAGEPLVRSGPTMGSTWSVRVDDPGPWGAWALCVIQPTLDGVEAALSTWRPDSDVSRVAAARTPGPHPVAPEVAALLRRALVIGAATGGAFDPTVGPLVDLWGFGPSGPRDAPPPAADVARLLAHVGLDRLVVRGAAIEKRDVAAGLTLDAIGDGWGADRVVEALRAAGVRQALVEVSGEVRALGGPYRVGLEDPGGGGLLGRAALADACLSSSATSVTAFVSGGVRYSHLIDPRTGRPTSGPGLGATVVAGDCVTADALSTALLLVEPSALPGIVARFPGVGVVRVDEGGRVSRYGVRFDGP